MKPSPTSPIIVVPAAILAAALVVTILSAAFLSTEPGCSLDHANVRLPDDPASATREIKKIRSALQSLRPKRTYIVIDTHANTIALRTADSILIEAACSSGSGDTLVDDSTGRVWIFDTPKGIFKVTEKLNQPWWRKPDWAYIEEHEPLPTNPGDRLDPNMMGDYALGFGDGYFIHGTIYERLLGVNVTHGCVRVGADDLKRLYNRTPIGTPIYIF